jgi:lysophospholipase L1-like esterase
MSSASNLGGGPGRHLSPERAPIHRRTPAGRFASRRAKLVLTLLAPIVFLGLLEVALRVAGFTWDPLGERPPQDSSQVPERTGFLVPHPRYLWIMRPDTLLDDPSQGFVEVRTNSLGLRYPEVPAGGAGEGLRILCLGDSITFGLGLREEETWPERMRQWLEERTGGPVTVVNAAVPGWSFVQGLRFYRDLAPHHSFDAVIAWFGMNDTKPANRGVPDLWWGPGEGLVRRSSDWLRHFRFFQLVQAAVFTARRALRGDRRVAFSDFRDAAKELAASEKTAILVRCPEQMDITIGQFAAVLDQARKEQVDLLLLPRELRSPFFPWLSPGPPVGIRIETDLGPALRFGRPDEEVMADRPARMAETLDRLLSWKELLDRYRAALPEGSPGRAELFGDLPPSEVFRDNCHLTARGAAVAGQALGRLLLERLPGR